METTTRAPERVLDIEPEGAGQVPAVVSERPAPRATVVREIQDGRPAGMGEPSRVIVRHSPEVGELFGALAAAQGKFKDLERTRTARIESAKARYTFDFETLADVIEATKEGLSENGLAVLQFPFPSRSEITLRTLLGHRSGQWISNDLTASLDGTDPRSIGSGITYLCRYARKAILGLAADYDDDAEAATPKDAPRPAQRVSQQAAARQDAARQAEPPRQADPAPAPDPAVGVVAKVTPASGGWFVELDNGFAAATKSEALKQTAEALMGAKRRVRLETREPKPGFARPLVSITVVDGEA